MILVDSSVLIDLLEKTPQWHQWSSEQLFAAAARDKLGINAMIYAEISRSFSSHEAQDAFIRDTGLLYLPIPAAAAYAASLAHRQYRLAGGTRAATLPDFFIGAHASVNSYTMMTRDAKRIHTYFPQIPIISPR
jgi:predicted nucleic acid-binding protein